MINANLTIKELLEKYPDGFSIAPSGAIQKTVFASSHFAAVARNFPVAPPNGGYLVVGLADDDAENQQQDAQEKINEILRRLQDSE